MSRSCRPPAARAAVRQAHGGVLSWSKGAAVFLLCAGAYAAETQVLEDSWAKILMAGSHIGWEHTVAKRVGDIVRISAEQYIRVGRWTFPTELRVTQTDVETYSGRPISFEQQTKMSKHPKRIFGRIRDGRLILSTTVMGETRPVELEWKKGAVLTWGGELKIRPLLKTGGSTAFQTYNVELGTFVEAKVEHLGREEVKLSGVRRRLHKLKITGLMPGKTIYEYRDDSGARWKRGLELMKKQMEFIRCAEKEARSIPYRLPDWGELSMIPSKGRLMQPRRVD